MQNCKRSKTGGAKLQAIKNWRRRRPGNEATWK